MANIPVNKTAHSFDKVRFEALLNRRFFYAPAFEIYGGACRQTRNLSLAHSPSIHHFRRRRRSVRLRPPWFFAPGEHHRGMAQALHRGRPHAGDRFHHHDARARV